MLLNRLSKVNEELLIELFQKLEINIPPDVLNIN